MLVRRLVKVGFGGAGKRISIRGMVVIWVSKAVI